MFNKLTPEQVAYHNTLARHTVWLNKHLYPDDHRNYAILCRNPNTLKVEVDLECCTLEKVRKDNPNFVKHLEGTVKGYPNREELYIVVVLSDWGQSIHIIHQDSLNDWAFKNGLKKGV